MWGAAVRGLYERRRRGSERKKTKREERRGEERIERLEAMLIIFEIVFDRVIKTTPATMKRSGVAAGWAGRG